MDEHARLVEAGLDRDAARDEGLIEPFVPAIVGAIHQAFSIATASTFVIGVATSLLAAGLVLFFRDAPATASEREWESGEGTSGEPSASAA